MLYAFFWVIPRRLHSDAGELPRRKHTAFRTQRKFEIKNHFIYLLLTGEWRKLHNEELTDMYCSPYIFRVIKSRRMIWAGHVARMGRGEVYTRFWWGNLRERDHLEDPGVDGRIILRWMFRKWGVGLWTGSSWLRIGTGGGHL